jgi:anti-sigma factor RsiW
VTVTDSNQHLPPWTIDELAEGCLSPVEKAPAMEHVRSCPECANDLESSRALMRALASLQSFEPSPRFADRVMARVSLPVLAPEPALRRRWLPRTRRGWMLGVMGALAPVLPLLAMLSWLTGRGIAPGSVFAVATRWASQAGWSALVKVAEVVVRSRTFEWLVTTGSDLVGGTQGLSVAGAVFAMAIPLSGWMLLRLLRAPVGGMTHAR